MTGERVRGVLAAVALGVCVASSTPPAMAQTPTTEELKAARELFNEAYRDEQEKRYPDALEKFRRVAKVRESASVRYRIGTVLAAMGKLREARDHFRALAAARSSLTGPDQEIADSAAERAAELDRRIPKLAIRVQDNPPADVRVTVDGAPVPVSTTPREIELDPGPHIVAASARGAAPSEETVTLAEGGSPVQHTVNFAPEKTPEPPPSPSGDAKSNVMPWVVVGIGGALALTGGALLLSREGDIGDIEAACPNNRCPRSLENDINDKRDRAELFGPLGGGLAIVGVAVVAVGVYLLVRGSGQASAATSSRSAGGRVAAMPSWAPVLGGMRGNGFRLQF